MDSSNYPAAMSTNAYKQPAQGNYNGGSYGNNSYGNNGTGNNGYSGNNSGNYWQENQGQYSGKQGQYSGNQQQYAGSQGQYTGNQQQYAGNQGQYSGNQRQYSGKQGQYSGQQYTGNQQQYTGNQGQYSGNQRQYSGKQGQYSGNRQQYTGNQQQYTGKQQQYTGNQGQYSGKQRQYSGKQGQFSGNQRQFSGNQRQSSGNQGQYSGFQGQNSGYKPNPAPKRKAEPESFPCETCHMTLNSQGQLDQHLVGKAHNKQLKKKLEAESNTAQTVQVMPVQTPQPQQVQRQGGASTTDNGASGGPSNDPVAKAIFDNAMGTLPKKRRVDINCDICDIMLTSQIHADSHFAGAKHLRKKKLKEETEAMNQSDMEQTEGVKSSGTGFHCGFCDLFLNSLQQLEAHRTGDRHKKSVEKKQKEAQSFLAAKVNPNKAKVIEKPECKTCSLFLNSVQQLQQHLGSAKHQEMLKLKGLLPGGAPKDPEEKAS